ncbi:hypothetical protein I3843_08G171300 [Carya illinoinensis]|uniref:Phosphatidylinositol N-acetylglucosaminyltransferase subunit H conserved domain-containing protein n=1 Tax=Carya illinoinensis TaxID=32201 RepID=A0A922EDL4_CARIL|nr:hypothetical protein I3842_08G176800 [Carya illinoinensis]KAG7968762.1 hypothetical protein I3843_08G171300 [Carya illinoinensis]
MAECGIFDKRYSYIHDRKWGSEAADAHHIIVRKSHAKGFLVYLSPILLLASAFHLFLFKDNITITFWNSLLIAFLVKLLLQKPVEKESVIVMPAFGVQLETHRGSKIVRRFVPIDKILKPVLSECVTPVTCYWSLSFIIRGEAELMLVFKEVCPPVKVLVPIWKALCAAIGSEGILGTPTADAP